MTNRRRPPSIAYSAPSAHSMTSHRVRRAHYARFVEFGTAPGTRANPEFQAKAVAARRANRIAKIPVPPWVPPELRDEFRRVFLELGEHEAAAHCRALKRRLASQSEAAGGAP